MQDDKVFSVTQLTYAIKQNLESNFRTLVVRGEVSNLRKQSSGHTYFTLKDSGAQISAALFRGAAASIKQLPKEGDEITVHGEISVYPPRGGYQIIVRRIEFSGVGQLLKQLHELKLKLKELGWFEESLKKPLPKIPKRIGVVTSPTGSVIQDIINVLKRRYPGFQLILNPVRVQGAEAAPEIANAIKQFNDHKLADVLIVGRGGGSIEDLWPFNEEIVAKAIKDSEIPIISAVGHETDITIADFVADRRAPTPSAAAEIAIVEKREELLHLDKAKIRLAQSLRSHLRSSRQTLETLIKQPPLSSPYMFLAPFLQKTDDMKEALQEGVKQTLEHNKLKLSYLQKRASTLIPLNRIQLLREKFTRLEAHLKAIDPRTLLKKGYSIVFRENKDSVILSKADVQTGENLRIKLHDGQLKVKVDE